MFLPKIFYLTGRAKSKNRVPYAIHIRGPGYWTRNFHYRDIMNIAGAEVRIRAGCECTYGGPQAPLKRQSSLSFSWTRLIAAFGPKN